MDIEEHCRRTWGKLVADLNESVRAERDRREKAEQRAALHDEDIQAGKAFRRMMRAVNEHDLVRVQWEKFMATLRICGYDKTGN